LAAKRYKRHKLIEKIKDREMVGGAHATYFLSKNIEAKPRRKSVAGSEFSYNCAPLRFSERAGTDTDVTALGPRAE